MSRVSGRSALISRIRRRLRVLLMLRPCDDVMYSYVDLLFSLSVATHKAELKDDFNDSCGP